MVLRVWSSFIKKSLCDWVLIFWGILIAPFCFNSIIPFLIIPKTSEIADRSLKAQVVIVGLRDPGRLLVPSHILSASVPCQALDYIYTGHRLEGALWDVI